MDLPRPALIGSHQIVNGGTAVAAALALKDPQLDQTAIERGLATVEWPARMQRLSGGPLCALLQPGSELWLDGGHNPAGAAAIAETLAALEERAPKPLVLVMGLMGQKDARGVLAPFRGLAQRIVTVPIPGAHEAPFNPEALAALAGEMGIAGAGGRQRARSLVADRGQRCGDAHPDLRLALPRRPRARAATRGRDADELSAGRKDSLSRDVVDQPGLAEPGGGEDAQRAGGAGG